MRNKAKESIDEKQKNNNKITLVTTSKDCDEVHSLVCDSQVTATSLHGGNLAVSPQAAWVLPWGQSLSLEQLSKLQAPRVCPSSERKRQDYTGQIPATKLAAQLNDSQGKREREEDRGQERHGDRAASWRTEASGRGSVLLFS